MSFFKKQIKSTTKETNRFVKQTNRSPGIVHTGKYRFRRIMEVIIVCLLIDCCIIGQMISDDEVVVCVCFFWLELFVFSPSI